MTTARLMTLNPGHFHAALVQKEMYPEIDPRVDIYGEAGDDLLAHLQRIIGFNTRKESPTSWQLEVHAGPNPLQRMLEERPGNVVVLAGFNRVKIDAIKAAVEAGFHVLSDKPWIIHHEDLPKLESALNTAEANGIIAYDIMTERYEITTMLQKELVNDADVFGEIDKGTADEPAIYMESIHYLMKLVAGKPNRRPVWYFDIEQQGEGLADVGTHLVDLVPWMLCSGEPMDIEKDIHIVSAKRWPTVMSGDDFHQVTGAEPFPENLKPWVENGKLNYFCNTQVTYQVRGAYVKLDVLWDYKAGPGEGDKHFASYRGSRSKVEIRQGKEQNFRPELYVVPLAGENAEEVDSALQKKIDSLQSSFPGVKAEKRGEEWQVLIPDQYRVGHEAHFAEVTRQFLKYLQDPKSLPGWEKPNMMAKYYVTTKGVEKSQG